MTPPAISDWLLERIACPYDRLPLQPAPDGLACEQGHRHRVVDGIPVLLRRDIEHTHHAAAYSLDMPERDLRRPAADRIDPYVQEAIAATGGYMYASLVGHLTSYPIPAIRLPRGDGRTLLDLGCNWGRWSIAAARAGYRVAGIDPSLEAVRAARRVASREGAQAEFVVGDARHLPFRDQKFDTIFSYSVLQHFSKGDVRTTLDECARVLTHGGRASIQMPNRWGLRSLYHQARRGFRQGQAFEVRYWTRGELRETFESRIGPTTISVDGFFTLNAQPAEAHLLPWRFRVIVAVSELLRRAATRAPALSALADSLYVDATADPAAR